MRLGATQLLHDTAVMWLWAAPVVLHVVVRPIFRRIPETTDQLRAWQHVLNVLLPSLLGAGMLAFTTLLVRLVDGAPVAVLAGIVLLGLLALSVVALVLVWHGPMRALAEAAELGDGREARRQMRRARDYVLVIGVVCGLYFALTAVVDFGVFLVPAAPA